MLNSIWQKIDEIFPLVADLPATEREARLGELCGGDESLLREIRALLAADEKAADFCEVPAVLPNSLSNAFAFSHREAPTEALAGVKIGAYRVLTKIGAGGMGEVYLARRDDGAFEKKVAVKFIRRGVETDFNLRRFRHERQVLAALEHPNIARLIDGGALEDGSPFLVMEYVEGRTLFDYCDSQNLDLTRRLELFRQICAAVGYAHDKQIVHRDLKPGNILVTDDGAVKLLDFGIAKILDADLLGEPVAQTETLLRQMTPEYASPEQIKGEEITPLSDVYSLGVILYELVTGERPYKFPSRAPHEMARIVCEETVRLPHYKFQIPKAEDLSFIILKALRKNPPERFASVRALEADIERFMRGLPIQTEETRLKFFEKSAGDSAGTTVSLAVAPFQILPNGDAEAGEGAGDDFFGIGLADALTTKLSGIRRLAVRPTSSVLRAAKSGRDACAVGRQLGADYVIEGHVLRAGARLRVSVQLLNTGDFSVLWAEQFDETELDVFRLQDSISARVAAALVPRLTSDEEEILHRHGTENAAAYEAYLRGRVFFHNYTFGGMSAAENCFMQSIALDPNFALSHCGLADFYNMQTIFGLMTNQEGFTRAKTSALCAIELDPNLAEAYAALAFTTWAYDWDFAEAEALFNKSFRLNPNYPRAREWYAFLLSVTERHDEALAEMRRAERLDPDSPAVATMHALVFYNARRFEEALGKTRRALELDQDYYIALQSLGWICPRLGKFDEAIAACRRAVSISDEQSLNKFSLALALIDAGQTTEARSSIVELETRRRTGIVPAYYLALLYAALGEDEKAFVWFENAIRERGYYTLRMRVEPRLDRLRRDPRFEALLDRINPQKTAQTTTGIDSPPTGKIAPDGKFKARATAAFAVLAIGLIFACVYAATNFDFGGASREPSVEEVAENVAENVAPLSRRVTSEKARTTDEVADGFYLAGKEQMATRTNEGIQKAIDFFAEAVKRDPNFALAFSGLADAHILCAMTQKDPAESYRKAEENALKALALDPDLAEARISLAMAKFRTTNDFAAAEKHFLRAIQINPRLATAHHWYSEILNEVGRTDDALREIEIAARLDENSAIIQFSLCHLYIYKGRYDESLTFCDKAIKVDKSFVMAYYWKSFVQQYQGRYDAALETYRTGRIYSGAGENEPLWILMQAQSHAAQKRRDEALKTLNRFLQSADFRKNPDQLPHEIALVYNLLGDRDRAFEWLARVEFNNGNSLRYISTDPRFANLHEDARFAALVEKWKSQIQPANRKN